MTTKNRDILSKAASNVIPGAIAGINIAQRLIEEGKAQDALLFLSKTKDHLEYLVPLFDAACKEGQ